MTIPRVLVLISGRGSNLAALARMLDSADTPGQLVGVIGNRPEAAGLQWARDHQLPTRLVDHRDFESRQAFDQALLQACEAWAPDLVVLAGFMRMLGEAFVQTYSGRLINIHPSLLPAFPGLHTHRRALQAGAKVAGATVHYVTPALDQGPIITQAVVPVRPGDDEQRLADRVLQAEHHILPLSVAWHLRGELDIHDGVVRHRGGAAQQFFFE